MTEKESVTICDGNYDEPERFVTGGRRTGFEPKLWPNIWKLWPKIQSQFKFCQKLWRVRHNFFWFWSTSSQPRSKENLKASLCCFHRRHCPPKKQPTIFPFNCGRRLTEEPHWSSGRRECWRGTVQRLNVLHLVRTVGLIAMNWARFCEFCDIVGCWGLGDSSGSDISIPARV